MTDGRRTPQDTNRRRALADAAAGLGWTPQRGDLAQDTRDNSVGVVVALPDDTGTSVYQLRPQGGGRGWSAPLEALRPHPDTTDDISLTLEEAVMPRPPDARKGGPR
ncbi:hypothetical protein [Streptomyces boncukensis]|uniref:Uncharacterized protein n=1 Tax=Streptomyces boncukensis TaxID=2711219 RepID=A0A6G4X0V3_9ACTN|nr:hypothetical protein [Streptomyces boncukensis]NGO70752.1 hypothetical protein [Streptomyces boncukensis]